MMHELFSALHDTREVARYQRPEPIETDEPVAMLPQIITCEYCEDRLRFVFPENEDGMKELDDALVAARWRYCRDGVQCGRHEIEYR